MAIEEITVGCLDFKLVAGCRGAPSSGGGGHLASQQGAGVLPCLGPVVLASGIGSITGKVAPFYRYSIVGDEIGDGTVRLRFRVFAAFRAIFIFYLFEVKSIHPTGSFCRLGLICLLKPLSRLVIDGDILENDRVRCGSPIETCIFFPIWLVASIMLSTHHESPQFLELELYPVRYTYGTEHDWEEPPRRHSSIPNRSLSVSASGPKRVLILWLDSQPSKH